MLTTQWIIDTMRAWAPPEWAEPWDNVGLLVGDAARPVARVLTALDLSEPVLREAVQGRFDVVVTHHPLFREGVRHITTDTTLGKKIMTLIGNGICLFVAHTNLDVAPGGVNDVLAQRLGLEAAAPLYTPAPGKRAMGAVGMLPHPMPLEAFAAEVGRRLDMPFAPHFSGMPGKMVQRVGVCGGGGTGHIPEALAAGCDVFVTGDVKYHQACETWENGLALVDGTHYATEAPIVPIMAQHLQQAALSQGVALEVAVSQADGQVFATPQTSAG